MLPSDPNYVPFGTSPEALASPLYASLLAQGIDPYASHSIDQSLIDAIEKDGGSALAVSA